MEKQFRKTFEEASRRKGVTGENLIKLLEARLDNTIYRLGVAPSRPAARQLVSHKHITVNGAVVNVPSYQLQAGDVIGGVDNQQIDSQTTLGGVLSNHNAGDKVTMTIIRAGKQGTVQVTLGRAPG